MPIPSPTTAAPTTAVTTTTAAATTTTAALTTTTDATTTTIDTNSLALGAGCTPGTSVLGDGRWFGYVDSADTTSIEFDLACWFSGDEAILAAAEDGEESPPPNDYYIRNVNPQLRTVAVAATANVFWLPDTGDPSNQTTVPYADWLAGRAARGLLEARALVPGGGVRRAGRSLAPGPVDRGRAGRVHCAIGAHGLVFRLRRHDARAAAGGQSATRPGQCPATQPECVAETEQRALTTGVIDNAKALAARMAHHGYRIVSGGTDNHLLLIDLTAKEVSGKKAERWLGLADITVNKNTVPFDTRKPYIASGLRIGTPAVTTQGMGTDEMASVASLISRCDRPQAYDISITARSSSVRRRCRVSMRPTRMTTAR